ncbi:beta-lactamase family protein [Gleimia sp. 6138-11-ORH1]|uniref:serine hydrolase domain-containing protein n=1 Tax=Gleimia sp. 6138-11-ORH1 TaxID=2973937 RepID=UPI00216A928A|nr:serine hydrolase domain-containing protein [Gleimia sp. 6138-11-ORH1]MCS4484812.1 beta-lactamase family protein [Gleimia sp. 6138-11-ORH1]
MIPSSLTAAFPFSVAFFDADGIRFSAGDLGSEFAFASVTKLLASRAFLVAVEHGLIDLDDSILVGEPARPTSLRQLLAHVSGVSFASAKRAAEVGAKRIYSNYAIDVAAQWLEKRIDVPFGDWLDEQVVAPLLLQDSYVDGSAAHAGRGSVRDLVRFGQELLVPQLISDSLAQEAASVQWPGLRGVTPGFGHYADNQWGLAMEIRARKEHTWFPSLSEDATFGHFGLAGSFLWVAPESGFGAAFLGAEPTGDWHKTHWQQLNDWLISNFG